MAEMSTMTERGALDAAIAALQTRVKERDAEIERLTAINARIVDQGLEQASAIEELRARITTGLTQLAGERKIYNDAIGRHLAEIERLKAYGVEVAQSSAARTVALETAMHTIARTKFSGSDMNEDYQRGNRDAHETCARMARAAIGDQRPANEKSAPAREGQGGC